MSTDTLTTDTATSDPVGEINKYDFRTESKAIFKAKKGLNKEIVHQISDMKDEPDWMREFRLQALDIFFAVLAGYGVRGDDAIDAIRGLRAAMHGFVTLEAGGGFGMPQSVDASYHRLVDALDTALTARPAADAPTSREEPS